MADSPQDEVYEVEKILDHKFIKKGKKTETTYFIKWLNYGEEDNTWERESNVFAVDLIIQYWDKFPQTSVDREMFEQIQSRKKNPLLLPSSQSHQEDQTNKIAGSSQKKNEQRPSAVASSSSPVPAHALKKQQNLTDNFKSVSPVVTNGSRKGKEKEEASSINDIESSAILKRTPTVVANEEDDIDKSDSEDEERAPSYRSSPSAVPSEENEIVDVEVEAEDEEEKDEIIYSEEEEVAVTPPPQKRKRTSYSDYFLEQHEKKKRRESFESNRSDSSLIDSVASVKSTSKETTDGDDDRIIFDENYGKEPPLDWQTLALKVEYIGKELPESPLYCTVKWKDDVKSIHPLELVREKRPDLVIDHFISLINKKEPNMK